MKFDSQNIKGKKVSGTIKQLGILGGIRDLWKAFSLAVLLVVAAIYSFSYEMPAYIGLGLLLIAVLAVLISIVRLKRIASARLEPIGLDENALAENVGFQDAEPEADEILIASIPAVMEYGKVRSVSVLGVGKVKIPENSLIITNKAIWAMTVPLAGADKVVADTDIGMWQWMVAYKDVIDGLAKMVAEMPLHELLQKGRARRLMSLDELKEVKDLPVSQAVTFIRTDGEKFGYSIRMKEDYLRARELFKNSRPEQ